MTKLKILNIQALRAIAVILVLFYHIYAIETKLSSTYSIIPDLFKYGNIGVDLFFVISGFIMVIVTKNYHKNLKKFLFFIYSRFTRIYPLYWFYTLLLIPILFLKPEWINSSQGNKVDLISSILLLPNEIKPLIMVGWSLIHELYFYIIFSFFILFDRKKLLGLSLFWVFLISLFINVESESSLFNLVTNPLTFEFITGIFFGIFHIRYSHTKFRLNKIFLFIPYFSFFLLPYFSDFINNGLGRYFVFGLLSLTILISSIELEKNKFIFNSFLVKIGDASYSIYLSHVLVINVFYRIYLIIGYDNFFLRFMLISVMSFSSIFWGLVSFKYIEKPMIKFFKKNYTN